jgi:hypothetical protein
MSNINEKFARLAGFVIKFACFQNLTLKNANYFDLDISLLFSSVSLFFFPFFFQPTCETHLTLSLIHLSRPAAVAPQLSARLASAACGDTACGCESSMLATTQGAANLSSMSSRRRMLRPTSSITTPTNLKEEDEAVPSLAAQNKNGNGGRVF